MENNLKKETSIIKAWEPSFDTLCFIKFLIIKEGFDSVLFPLTEKYPEIHKEYVEYKLDICNG